MDKFKEGGIVYHKATSKRCVIININDDKTIKVRDEDNQEQNYYPQELKTEEEDRSEFGFIQTEPPNLDPYE